jgi:hypothetical protein
MQYEVKLAEGRTLQEFQSAINEIANIRQGEVTAALDRGEDVLDHEAYWFQPKSAVSYEGGIYHQVWMRQRP